MTLRTVWPQASRVVRPTLGKQAHHVAGADQVDEVELDVLARGDVAAAQAGVLLGDLAHHVHLLGVDAAVGQLDAHHLLVHLALAVGAHAQAERRELALQRFGVGAVARGLELVVLDLFVERDEDMPGLEVGRDLWVCLEREWLVLNSHRAPPPKVDIVDLVSRNCM